MFVTNKIKMVSIAGLPFTVDKQLLGILILPINILVTIFQTEVPGSILLLLFV